MKDSNKNIICTLAFVALVSVAITTLLGSLLGGSMLFNIIETIKNVCVILVVGIIAYDFTKGKEKWVSIVYWVAVAVFIIGAILVWFK